MKFGTLGVDHDHLREGAHEGHVLHGLVRGTVLAEGDTRVGGGDLHIGLAVGDFLTDLVIDTAGHELREGADEGDLAGDGETGGGADHVGLGDAALDETLRELRGEGIHLEGALEVRGEGDDAAVRAARFEKTHAETAAGVLLACIDILFHCCFELDSRSSRE